MASALLNRKLGLAELRDEFVRSDKVQALMRRVRVTTTDQADPHEPVFAPFDVLSVTLADGSTRRRESKRHPKGHARDPIGLAELRAKFDDCTGRQQRALFERLLHLDAQPSVAALYSG